MWNAPESEYYAPLPIAFPMSSVRGYKVRNSIWKDIENLYYKRVLDNQCIDFLVIRALTPSSVNFCNGRRAERF